MDAESQPHLRSDDLRGNPRLRIFGAQQLCRDLISLFIAMARALVLSLVLALASAESVKDCIESKCSGCGGEQCQLCREDVNTVSACLSSCMDSLCRACGGEQCQLCREDASHIETGLTKSHKGWHLHPPPISEEVYRFVVGATRKLAGTLRPILSSI